MMLDNAKESNNWLCSWCSGDDYDKIDDPIDIMVDRLVRFANTPEINESKMKDAIVLECPFCFGQYWFHVSKRTIEEIKDTQSYGKRGIVF